MRNPEDRLRKDYDVVENLGDLIAAREERDSAFADDVDALEDIDLDHLEIDAGEELSYPHKHEPSEDERLGLDVELMDTPSEREVEFDWQDSAEEMLATDPDPNEGMGLDAEVEAASRVSPFEAPGPVPSNEVSPETDTGLTAEEFGEIQPDDRTPERCHIEPAQIEGAMETDSDEESFSIADRFAGELDRETALEEMDDLRQAIEKEQD